jgi:predicted transcriptional regulator
LKKDISLKEDEDYIYEAISQLNNQQIGRLSHILFEE